jgi:DNA repair exonuclease SbcCD nuclease subunit
MRILHTSDWHIGRTFHDYPTPIGLISHVAEMKEISAKLHVDKIPHGPSTIRQVNQGL